MGPETSRRWAQVPSSAASGSDDVPNPRLPTWARWAVAWFVAAVGPTIRTLFISPAPGWIIVAVAAGLGVAVVARITSEQRFVRALAAGAAGAATIGAGGFWVGVWTSMSVVLAAWVVLHAPLDRRIPHGSDAAIPGIALLQVVAGWQSRAPFDRYLPVAITVASFGLAWVANRYPSYLARATQVIARAASAVVSVVLFGFLAIITVMLPWTVDRVARHDPIAYRRIRGSGWLERRDVEIRPKSPWSVTRYVQPAARWGRVRRRVVVGVLLVGGLSGAVIAEERTLLEAGTSGDRPAAFVDAPWWDELSLEEQAAYFDPGYAYNPLRYPLVRNVASTYINVENGERRTWAPPAGATPRITVWVYGGSTIVGLGQRDHHTIASELARLAWRDGIALNVRNRGVLGDLHWEEAQRFGWDVDAEVPPDVVAFYSGYNDMVGTNARLDGDVGLDGTPVDWTAESAMADNSAFAGNVRRARDALAPEHPRVAASDPPVERPQSGAELGRYVVRQYDIARKTAVRAAADTGVSAYWFWQPTRFHRQPVDGEPQKDDEFERLFRSAHRAARKQLPSDVVDISDVFDDVSRPIFYDDVHTNEEGARIVAASIYRTIEPRLRELSERPSAR